jgi:hypothetical protein
MQSTINTQALREGKRYLSWLRQDECPNFRVYKDHLVEALEDEKYTEGLLGATKIDVLKYAFNHARKAVRPEGTRRLRLGEWFVNIRIKDELELLLLEDGYIYQGVVKEATSALAA